MPLGKIVFKPGVNRETTSYGNDGGWFDSSLIRFRKGRPEKMGGWIKLSSVAVKGQPRSLNNWAALDGSKYMGVGTESKMYVEEGGLYNDITPIRSTATLGTNPFTTGSATSNLVTVAAAGHGASTGDFVTFTGAATTDGITAEQLNLEFEITTIDGNNYTISTAGSATSGATAGGGSAVIATYQISIGLSTYVQSTGFGAGLWGGTASVFSQTTLASDIDSSATSVVLTDAGNFEVAADALNGAITIASVILIVDDSSNFPDQGTVLVGSEKIKYTVKTATTFTGLTRGADGTTAATAADNATVTFVGLIQIDDELLQYTGKSGNTLNAGVVRGVRGTTAAAHTATTNISEANDFIGWGDSSSITGPSGNQLRLWNQDTWGEDLIFNSFDGSAYYWDKDLGLTARSSILSSQSGASGTPSQMRQIMVSGSDRHVIAFGCNALGETTQDLLQIRWSNQEDPFNWTPTSTNTSGDQRLSSGSEIIRAIKTRSEILVWTDVSLHSMRFVGPPLTFGFSLLANGTSLLSPNAVVSIDDKIFWMARENFHAYTGKVETVPCTVLRYVFDDINLAQKYKFFAASNRMFNEVIWFYVSSTASEIDRYAKFNYVEGTWDIGVLSRTAWVDYGVNDFPRAAGTDSGSNYIYNHEFGTTADGAAMTSFIESSDFDLDPAGEKFMFISRMIPDIDIATSSSATVDYILKTRDYPGDTLATNSTSAISSTTQQAFLRARARQAAIRIQSSASDIEWTLGDLRLEARPDGER